MFKKHLQSWKPGKVVRAKKVDPNLVSLYVPLYQITHSKVPIAMIINGKQVIYRKMPNKRDYFIDPDFGLFEIKPEKAYFPGSSPMYIYDVRNQNPIEPEIFAELFQWANSNGLYKIRRVDIEHGSRLRNMKQSDLVDQNQVAKREIKTMIDKIEASIEIKNQEIELKRQSEQGSESGNEYKKYDETDTEFIIVENLLKHNYINKDQASILNHKLTVKKINSMDELLHEIDTFTDVHVSKPIKMELERVLDDFHTYRPSNVIQIIQLASKISKGLKNLRTKPLVNWFPATYLLFGCLGVGIIIVLYLTYGQQSTPLPTP